MRDYGRLLRLSLAPSAIADIAAGIVLGAGLWPGGSAPWLLILASLCVYHGGMALNDWADREHDGRTRPERPIPSGAVPASAGLFLALALLLSGPALALAAGGDVALLVGGIAILAAWYDLLGRGPWIGPLLLALCRGGNLLAGIWLGRGAELATASFPGPDPLGVLAVPALYGAYVFAVSQLGRMEDAEDAAPLGRRPARVVAVLAAVLLVLPILPLPEIAAAEPSPGEPSARDAFLRDNRITLSMLIAAAGAFGLLRLAFRRMTWRRAHVLPAMGMALRRLLVFTSATAMMRGTPHGLVVALLILGGYPLSHALRRVFPPS